MSKVKLSVGMPVYNGQEFLASAIDSILNQSFKDFELIISDNASTDATEQICQEYAAKDPRVRYFRNAENIGASDNYNAVYHHAQGEYFKWASSNDLCDPRFLEECVNVLEQNQDVVLCYPQVQLFAESLEDARLYDDDLHLMQDSACERYREFLERVKLNNVMNGVMRTAALRNTAMIKPYYSSDTALMAELVLKGKIYQVRGTYFFRRMDEKTATALKSQEEVVKHYFPNLNKLMLFQKWKLQSEYYAAIKRAVVGENEKKCLKKYFFRQLRWQRRVLFADLKLALKKYMHNFGKVFVRSA